ncbi:hypothetical protein [Paracoccus rhizosphaerae]|uniref:hypothetical protein n=1 Tax=Paracoccus rhizosphaerae TaxID=1133347 RepID=UPI003612AAAF
MTFGVFLGGAIILLSNFRQFWPNAETAEQNFMGLPRDRIELQGQEHGSGEHRNLRSHHDRGQEACEHEKCLEAVAEQDLPLELSHLFGGAGHPLPPFRLLGVCRPERRAPHIRVFLVSATCSGGHYLWAFSCTRSAQCV